MLKNKNFKNKNGGGRLYTVLVPKTKERVNLSLGVPTTLSILVPSRTKNIRYFMAKYLFFSTFFASFKLIRHLKGKMKF